MERPRLCYLIRQEFITEKTQTLVISETSSFLLAHSGFVSSQVLTGFNEIKIPLNLSLALNRTSAWNIFRKNWVSYMRKIIIKVANLLWLLTNFFYRIPWVSLLIETTVSYKGERNNHSKYHINSYFCKSDSKSTMFNKIGFSK